MEDQGEDTHGWQIMSLMRSTDGVLGRSPTSRRTAPRTGRPRPYVATTEQIWALHDAMEARYRAGCYWPRRWPKAPRGVRAPGFMWTSCAVTVSLVQQYPAIR